MTQDDKSRRLVILDQGLSQKTGHYFEYDMALALEAQKQGYDVQICAHKNWAEPMDFIIPYFSVKVGSSGGSGRDKAHRILCYLPKTLRQFLYKPARLMYRLLTDFKKNDFNQFVQEITALSFDDNDVVLVPNASYDDALKLSQGTIKNIHLLLRQLPQSRAEEVALMRLIEQTQTKDTHFWTDTDDLTKWLNVRGLDVKTLPIPMHVPDFIDGMKPQEPYTFAMLGPVRAEKNTQLTPDLIRAFSDELRHDKVAFTIQMTRVKGQVVEPVVEVALAELTKLSKEFPNIELIDGDLSMDDFYRAIGRSSCVLIPYDKKRYQNRSSGLLVQSMLCARPAIVPNDTWMSDQLPHDLSAYVWMDDLVKTCRHVMSLSPNMRIIKKDWQSRHSASVCVKKIMQP